MADWRFSNEAQRELQSCRVDPPAPQPITGRPEWFDHKDPRVKALKRIWKASEPKLDTVEWRAWVSMGPEEAIRSAISQNRKAVAA